MSSSTSLSKENPNSFERRSRPRQSLPCLVVAFFENKNWGKLLEINEDGMSLRFTQPPPLHQRINFTLMPIPRAGQAFGEKFEQAGEILWTRAFDRMAGVRFLDMAEPSRQQILQWLSLRKPAARVTPAQEEAPTQMETVAVEPIKAPASPSETLPEPELVGPAAGLNTQEAASSLRDQHPRLAVKVAESFKTQESTTEPTFEPEPLFKAKASETWDTPEPITELTSKPEPLFKPGATENWDTQEPITEPPSEPDPLFEAEATERLDTLEPLTEPTPEPELLFASGATDNLETQEPTSEPSFEPESLFVGQEPEEPELPPLDESGALTEQAKYETKYEKGFAANRSINRRVLVTSVGLLAALSLTGCVKLAVSFWRARSEAIAAKGAGDPVERSSRASTLTAESTQPFQVEVQDASGKRWLLSFGSDGSRDGLNSDVARSALRNSSSRIANKAATPKETGSSEKSEQAGASSFPVPKLKRATGAAPDSNAASIEVPALSSQLAFPPAELVPSPSVKPVAPAGANELQHMGGQVQQARLLRSQPASYPALAKANRVNGDVVMDAVIGPAGKVTDVTVVSGPVLLRNAAMEALRRWTYEPARLDGQPVAMRLRVTIKFHIN